jgi:peptidoglycan-N-acetylglucosamine deacetylase
MLGMLIIFISVSRSIIPFFEEIQTPIGPKNGVTITFDDGPHPKHTDEILDILKEKKVHATFFII